MRLIAWITCSHPSPYFHIKTKSLKRVLICLDFHQPLFKGRLTRTRTNGKENKRLGQGLGFLILLSIKNINPLGLSDVDLNHTRT